jgi:sodium transport system ATP-binding protein
MIECCNLKKVYLAGTRREKVAVGGISFGVRDGEVFGLLGANGAGKTSTLRTVATILKATAGDCLVDGYSVTKQGEEARRRMGYLSGETRLYERLTPTEVVTFFGQFFDLPADVVRERRERLLDSLGMREYAHTPCGELSTGMKQMVSIARALVHDPTALVLDEPTSGLDIFAARRVLEVIRGLAGQGKAVLFSTHIMSQVEKICDRAAIIHRGCILVEGTVEEMKARAGCGGFEDAFFALVEAHDAALA